MVGESDGNCVGVSVGCLVVFGTVGDWVIGPCITGSTLCGTCVGETVFGVIGLLGSDGAVIFGWVVLDGNILVGTAVRFDIAYGVVVFTCIWLENLTKDYWAI